MANIVALCDSGGLFPHPVSDAIHIKNANNITNFFMRSV